MAIDFQNIGQLRLSPSQHDMWPIVRGAILPATLSDFMGIHTFFLHIVGFRENCVMSNPSEPLTALQLYEIRAQLRQSAVAMAGILGVNSNTYYHYERTGKIPRPVAVAARFLATQTQIAERPTEKTRTVAKFKSRFLPGARFGKLVVVSHSPTPKGSRRPQVQVRCDCDKELVLRIHDLELMTHCGPTCKVRPPKPQLVIADAPTNSGADPDEPDLEAPTIEWLKYNDRKAREKEAPNSPTPAPAEEEWEAGL